MKLSREIKSYMAKLGAKGGKTRARNLSSDQRSAIARSGALAMHKKRIAALETSK